MKRLSTIFLMSVALSVNAQILPPTASYIMEINNVSARFNANGIHFREGDSSHYETPIHSGKHTIFAHTLWIGGVDDNGQLKLAAMKHGQVGNDYWTGPLSQGTALLSTQTAADYDRFWVIDRSDILTFLSSGGTVISNSILDWPAHGDTTMGQSFYLAPFKDVDGDGIYNPHNGDYPLMRGDRTAFYIFNDNGGTHTETGGASLGLEVHAMIYGFNAPQDSALNNTLFVNYKLHNRSSTSLSTCFVGLWTDLDIGYDNDDYVGCDVLRGSYYGYNGIDSDYVYGKNIPVQAITLLGGPTLPADGQDNPAFVYDLISPVYCAVLFSSYGTNIHQYAYNGLNFGDGIIDNERMGMTNFLYHDNSPHVATGEPGSAIQYYNLMHGLWRDISRMRYGGNGHMNNGGTGPECNFMFPGITDPCNWGTGGEAIPAQYQNSEGWTEKSANNPPYDKRGVGSMGPFSFPAGGMQELDYALITLPTDTTQNPTHFAYHFIDTVRKAFASGETPYGQEFVTAGLSKPAKAPAEQVAVYPNPAKERITILLPASMPEAHFMLYDLQGRQLLSQNIQNGESIPITHLSTGFFLYTIKTAQKQFTGKLIKE